MPATRATCRPFAFKVSSCVFSRLLTTSLRYRRNRGSYFRRDSVEVRLGVRFCARLAPRERAQVASAFVSRARLVGRLENVPVGRSQIDVRHAGSSLRSLSAGNHCRNQVKGRLQATLFLLVFFFQNSSFSGCERFRSSASHSAWPLHACSLGRFRLVVRELVRRAFQRASLKIDPVRFESHFVSMRRGREGGRLRRSLWSGQRLFALCGNRR